MRKLLTVVLAVIAMGAGSASADVVSLVGDKDCFGLPGVASCPPGSLWNTGLGGTFFTDYRGPGDPLYTDEWASFGSVSFTHNYAVPAGATSATLQLLIAGIHDINAASVYTVFVDGTAIGVIPPNFGANAFEEVLSYSFLVPLGLLDGSSVITWSGTGGDGYAIDFSELTLFNGAVVPEPATLALLSLALLAAGAVRRRR